MWNSQPTSSPVSSKIQVASSSISMSKARPTAGLALMPLVPSEPPQMVPTTSSLSAIGTRVWRASAASRTQATPSAMVLRVPPLLDGQRGHRPPVGDGLLQLALVHALATQRHQQRRAHVGMRGDGRHHALGVAVRKTARKADQMHLHVAFQMAEIQRDLARHVMRALDQIGHHDDIAYALAAVGARIAAQGRGGGFHGVHLSSPKWLTHFTQHNRRPSHRDATEPALPGGRRSPGESAQGFGATHGAAFVGPQACPGEVPIVERMALFQRVGRRVVAVEVVRMDVVPGRDLGQAADDGAVLQDLLALGHGMRASLCPGPAARGPWRRPAPASPRRPPPAGCTRSNSCLRGDQQQTRIDHGLSLGGFM